MITGKLDTVDGVERELAALNAAGAALLTEIEQLEARQAELDEGDQVTAAMGAAQAARNRLRKLDARIAEAQGRLQAAQARARAKLRSELLGAFAPAARKFVAAAEAVQEALGQVIAAREALQAAGFHDDYRRLPIPPAINMTAHPAPDLVKRFEAAIDLAPVARPGPRLVVPKPTPAERYSAARQRAAAQPIGSPLWKKDVMEMKAAERELGAPAAKPARPRVPRRETAADGEKLLHLHTGTMDHPRKGRLHGGDIVSMTVAEGEPIIRNKGGDWIDAEEVASLDRGLALNGLLATKKDSAE